ncbi:DUF6155 family protein [Crocinitomix algicola]|uniref:DUF6155 family protein n=1 Tax=Crocinitomix algicola TaxID=1740263 RepID=UPI00087301CC|nr:DUF6155 family protein [Crocinitomix algicola]
MSKRALSKYLKELSKSDLEEQVLELYDRLKEVKEFYDFVFNPNEDKLLEDAKFKISKEYFPIGKRKAKKRRSIAQNIIKNYIKLGVDSSFIADVMLFNIEVAQTYNETNTINGDAFYKSMLKSFKDAVKFIDSNGLEASFNERLERITEITYNQNWVNKRVFEDVLDKRF